MKRIITLFAVIALCATPAFAAGKPGNPVGAGNGGQSRITNQTTVEDVTITTKRGGKTDIGVVENKGGAQDDVENYTTIKGVPPIVTESGATTQYGVVSNEGGVQKGVRSYTKIEGRSSIHTGRDATTRFSTVENRGKKQQKIVNSTSLNKSTINNDGTTNVGVVRNQ